MSAGPRGFSAGAVAAWLRGVVYPASRASLLTAAAHNRAPKELQDILCQLPGEEFGRLAAVQRAVSLMQADERDDPGQGIGCNAWAICGLRNRSPGLGGRGVPDWKWAMRGLRARPPPRHDEDGRHLFAATQPLSKGGIIMFRPVQAGSVA